MTTLSDAVAAWKPVDYPGSGDLLDASGNGHDATPLGSPTFTVPYFVLDGIDDTFRIDDHADLNFGATDSFSLVWAGFVSSGWAGAPMVKKLSFNEGNAGYSMAQVNGSMRTSVDDGTTQTVTTFPGADIIPLDTIFDAGSIRDGGAAQDVSWTHDGTENDITTDATSGTLSNALDLYLGSREGSNNFHVDRFYGAAVFDVVLTAAEVKLIAAELQTASDVTVIELRGSIPIPGI